MSPVGVLSGAQPQGCQSRCLSHSCGPRPDPGWQAGPVTSLISLILEPPFPIRDPHWLAGTTSLSVTGGLLVAGLLLMELIMSWVSRTYVLVVGARGVRGSQGRA